MKRTRTQIRPWIPIALLDRILEDALSAHRSGTFAGLCRTQRVLVLGVLRRYGGPIIDMLAPRDPAELVDAARTLLLLGIEQARPDGLPSTPIPSHAWLGASVWRPLIALLAQSGLAAVPDFPRRYRPRADEPPSERLCGLWDVAPSSFYRYVERGREQLLTALCSPLDAEGITSQYDFAQRRCILREGIVDSPDATRQWHLARHGRAMLAEAFVPALWHAMQAESVDSTVDALTRGCQAIAAQAWTDTVLTRFVHALASPLDAARIDLARAAVARVRGAADAEQRLVESAAKQADLAADRGLLGRAYCARGRFFELRDPERAFADFRRAIDCYEVAFADDVLDEGSRAGHLESVVRLAYLHMQRNDPQGKTMLERADSMAQAYCTPHDTLALLEHAKGELARREGDTHAALECTQRALQHYELSGNWHQVLRTESALAMYYGNAGDLVRAESYARRVFEAAAAAPVDPHTVAATRLNLGVAYFWVSNFDAAIEQYTHALDLASKASLRTPMGRANYNLAEAHYERFAQQGDPTDEQMGDEHAAQAKAIWQLDGDASAQEATAGLKQAVLGKREHLIYDRMLSGELAAHVSEMAEIQTQRNRLAMALSADDRTAAHLRIARAYAAIAAKEREAALASMAEQDSTRSFEAELTAVRTAFEAALSLEQRVRQAWLARRDCPTAPEYIPALVQRLVRGGVLSKSLYASVTGSSPATASKHLRTLCEIGLLERSNRGPATSYALRGVTKCRPDT